MMTGATRRFGIAKALAVGLCLILAGCDTTSVDPSDSKQTNPKAQTADGGSTTVASYSGDGLSVKDVGEDESTMLAFEDTTAVYRMQGRIECHNYWFFSEALVQTRWQEKQSFLWWEWWENVGNSDFYHNWDGIVWESGPSGGYEETVVGSEDEGSGAQLENQIYWTFGFGVLVGGDVSGYHEIDNSTLSTNCSTQT